VPDPNWFIGLPFRSAPDLGPLPPRVRALAPGDLHVTLAFLGPVGEAAAGRAWAIAEAIAFEAIPASLGRLALLGHPRAPSAVAARLEDGRTAVETLIASHRGALLDAAGARPDDRPPHAHVTVARVQRKASPIQRRNAEAWAAELEIAARARLDGLALYTWSNDRSARKFDIVASTSPEPAP
jgi:2'-5' RNA ligase